MSSTFSPWDGVAPHRPRPAGLYAIIDPGRRDAARSTADARARRKQHNKHNKHNKHKKHMQRNHHKQL
jgi:hypothetical protein